MRKAILALAFSQLVFAARADDATADSRALAIHDRALTVNVHLDIRDGFAKSGAASGQDTGDQFDLPRLECGKMDVAVVALYSDPRRSPPTTSRRRAPRWMPGWRRCRDS